MQNPQGAGEVLLLDGSTSSVASIAKETVSDQTRPAVNAFQFESPTGESIEGLIARPASAKAPLLLLLIERPGDMDRPWLTMLTSPSWRPEKRVAWGYRIPLDEDPARYPRTAAPSLERELQFFASQGLAAAAIFVPGVPGITEPFNDTAQLTRPVVPARVRQTVEWLESQGWVDAQKIALGAERRTTGIAVNAALSWEAVRAVVTIDPGWTPIWELSDAWAEGMHVKVVKSSPGGAKALAAYSARWDGLKLARELKTPLLQWQEDPYGNRSPQGLPWGITGSSGIISPSARNLPIDYTPYGPSQVWTREISTSLGSDPAVSIQSQLAKRKVVSVLRKYAELDKQLGYGTPNERVTWKIVAHRDAAIVEFLQAQGLR
jgi:hypothetical protein